MSRVKVLVIGTEESEVIDIKNMLGAYEVVVARGTRGAVRILTSDPRISIVLIDRDSIGPDALDIPAFLHENPRLLHVRTIVLAQPDHEDIESSALRAGADDVLRKPLVPESLRARIHLQLLRLRQSELISKVQEQELLFNAIFWQAPIGISISHGMAPSGDDKDDLFDVNPMFEQITGRSKDELKRVGWKAITHPDDVAEDLRQYKRLYAGEIASYAMEKRYYRPDGSVVWVHMIVASLDLPNMQARKHVCIVQDITIRKQMEEALAESERSKSVLLKHLPGMAYRCSYDKDWTMQYVSAGCHGLTGYVARDLLENRLLSFNQLIAPEYRELLWTEWKRVLAHRLPFKREYEILTSEGNRKWVLEMGQGVFNDKGEVDALEGIILDISERKQIESELAYQYEHDVWTGLFNRRYFEKHLREDLKDPDSIKRAIISINLSSVHELSTRYGFQYSQDIIKRIAWMLNDLCDEHISLFNTYENRFVLYVRGYGNKDELMGLGNAVSHTLDALLSVERIGWGLGIIEIDERNRHDIDTLLRDLLIASERSLGSFSNEFKILFFDKDMERDLDREETITNRIIRIATGRDPESLLLHYQPIIDLRENRIFGFEALARMRDAKLDLVPPLEFIPIAERTKLIVPLGERIIRSACMFQRRLSELGYPTISIAINISPIQLLGKAFLGILPNILRETGVSPSNIVLEITESVVAFNFQEVNHILGKLRAMGIRVALDDFGTGYSSLSRERELHIDCIKIDRSFIARLLTLAPGEAITGDIISMAHRLGHSVVAEGVEESSQLAYLRDHGCDMIQGYLISKPVDEESAIKLLDTWQGGNV